MSTRRKRGRPREENRQKRIEVIEHTLRRHPKARGVDIAKLMNELNAFRPPDEKSLRNEISDVRRRLKLVSKTARDVKRREAQNSRETSPTDQPPTPGGRKVADAVALADAAARRRADLPPGARSVDEALLRARDGERRFAEGRTVGLAEGLARAQCFARAGPGAATARFAPVPPGAWVCQATNPLRSAPRSESEEFEGLVT
jgi:hypothetical protein